VIVSTTIIILNDINPLALELSIYSLAHHLYKIRIFHKLYSLAHHLYKIRIFHKPRWVTLENTRHFVEE